jgi:hypothetical protein
MYWLQSGSSCEGIGRLGPNPESIEYRLRQMEYRLNLLGFGSLAPEPPFCGALQHFGPTNRQFWGRGRAAGAQELETGS